MGQAGSGIASEEKEYIIFCDESERKGKFFSNFYGGIRIGASDIDSVSSRLALKKTTLGLTGEIKWNKTDKSVVERYEELIDSFFEEVESGKVICRVMFTQNARVARN